jgi:hypothetical protein
MMEISATRAAESPTQGKSGPRQAPFDLGRLRHLMAEIPTDVTSLVTPLGGLPAVPDHGENGSIEGG